METLPLDMYREIGSHLHGTDLDMFRSSHKTASQLFKPSGDWNFEIITFVFKRFYDEIKEKYNEYFYDNSYGSTYIIRNRLQGYNQIYFKATTKWGVVEFSTNLLPFKWWSSQPTNLMCVIKVNNKKLCSLSGNIGSEYYVCKNKKSKKYSVSIDSEAISITRTKRKVYKDEDGKYKRKNIEITYIAPVSQMFSIQNRYNIRAGIVFYVY